MNTREKTLLRQLLLLAALIALGTLIVGILASWIPDGWEFLRWLLALTSAILGARYACERFLDYLRVQYLKIPNEQRGVPVWLVGAIEQLVFVVAVGAFYNDRDGQALAAVFTVMAVWLGAKMVTGWNRADPIIVWSQSWQERVLQRQQQDRRAAGALSALLAGVVALAIATIGGNIAAGGKVVKFGEYLSSNVADAARLPRDMQHRFGPNRPRPTSPEPGISKIRRALENQPRL